MLRNVYGITSRNYNVGFLFQVEQKDKLEIGKLFHARS